MTKILILGTSILAVAPVDAGNNWETPGQIIPKTVAAGAQLVDAILPDGFAPSRFEWTGAAVTARTDPPSVVAVPERVTRRQARQALLLAGLLGAVQPAIDAITDPLQRGLAQIEWDDSLEFERNRPLVVAIGAALGLDAAALDALFITAAEL